MTNEQLLLKTKLDTAIDAVRNLVLRDDLGLDTRIALAIADAHLRHCRALLEADTKRG
jgi:hypothetical protein